MQCKNCENSLRTDYSYCPDCGAKVIRNRITFKNLWYDLAERFFNVDNTFLRTFIGLFTKPEVVISGYIDGVRKKFMNPISYFTIALTLGGILLIFMKNDLIELTSAGQMAAGADAAAAQNAMMPQVKKWVEAMYEYQNLFYLSSIPLLVVISRVVFWNHKKYNLSEHFVINLYAYSHMSIIVNTLYLLSSFNSKVLMIVSQLSLVGYVAYYVYMFKRLFNLNWQSLVLKTLLFLCILMVLFIIFTVGISIYMFTQPEFLEQIKAAKEAQGG